MTSTRDEIGRIRIRDRRDGTIFEEHVYGETGLRLLYQRWPGRILTPLLTRTAIPTRLCGWFQRTRWSRRRISRFVASLGVDDSEAEHPVSAYGSLDAFFARRLRPGARPVDATPEHLVAPCDGRALVMPRLDGTIRVKRTTANLSKLLGDDRRAVRYETGTAVVIRLAPVDYHRFHFPDSGRVGHVTRIAGGLHSVHPIASAAGAPSFLNARTITWLETERFGTLGLIEVGALLVGSIVQTFRPGAIERGAEKGYFHFGGSTVVVLAEPGRLEVDHDLVRASAAGLETLVRMGTRIGCAASVLRATASPEEGGVRARDGR